MDNMIWNFPLIAILPRLKYILKECDNCPKYIVRNYKSKFSNVAPLISIFSIHELIGKGSFNCKTKNNEVIGNNNKRKISRQKELIIGSFMHCIYLSSLESIHIIYSVYIFFKDYFWFFC